MKVLTGSLIPRLSALKRNPATSLLGLRPNEFKTPVQLGMTAHANNPDPGPNQTKGGSGDVVHLIVFAYMHEAVLIPT